MPLKTPTLQQSTLRVNSAQHKSKTWVYSAWAMYTCEVELSIREWCGHADGQQKLEFCKPAL